MRIVTISDNPNINSGLSRVHRKILDSLIEAGHEVFPCVWFGYSSTEIEKLKKGEPVPEIFYKNKKMYAVPKSGQASMMATSQAIEELKPDWVISIGDYWSFFFLRSLKARLDYSFKWLAYLTIEEENIDTKWKPLFEHMDVVASPTKFGVKSISKLGIEAHYVPYGVDDIFKPIQLEERQKIRQERNIDKKIRFITVAQNTIRKNIPIIFLGFKELQNRNEKLAEQLSFHIHTNLMAKDPLETYIFDLIKIAENLDILNYFTFPMDDTSVFSTNAPKDLEIAKEYGISDFCLSTSSSEGFGLPLVEAMACGIPCIGSNNTGITEHLSGRGILIDTKKAFFPPSFMVNAVDPHSVSEAIERAAAIYGCEKYQNMAKESVLYASEMKWEIMSKKILELMKEEGNILSIPIEVV